MSSQNGSRLTPPYPETRSIHRRQVWWQIFFPLLIAVLIFLALAVLAAWGTNSNAQVAQWGNISTVFVVMPGLALLLVVLVILGALIYGLYRLLKVLPGFMANVQEKVDMVADALRKFSDKAAKPVIVTQSAWAGLKRLFNPE